MSGPRRNRNTHAGTPSSLAALGLLFLAGGAAPSLAQPTSYSLAGTISFTSPSVNQAIPRVRGSAGDLNGDGLADFGVHYSEYGPANPGRMIVYSGFDGGVLFDWVGQPLFGPTGFCCTENPGKGADFLDVDGDGYQEILLGIPESFLGSIYAVGRVEVVSPLPIQGLYTVWGEAIGDLFGDRVVAVGDTSGNGVPDFMVNAPGADSPTQVNASAWYLLEGADGSVRQKYLGTFPFEMSGPATGVGDVDGDGLSDIAIGVPLANGVTGLVRVYSGFNPSTLIRIHNGSVAMSAFGGGAMFELGDVNGDGLSDYVLSTGPFGGGSGNAWLFSGFDGQVLLSYGIPPSLGFAQWGDGLDDLDGDGVAEVALVAAGTYYPVGSFQGSGEIQVFSGATGAFLQAIRQPSLALLPPGAAFGGEIQNAGDLDGDGHDDFVAGRNPGPLFVYHRDIATVVPDPVPIGSTAVFGIDVPAQPGTMFHLLFSGSANSGVVVGTRIFPLDADAVLLASLENPAFGGVLDAAGAASVSIPVPSVPALSGLTVQYAVVTLSPSWAYGVRTIGTAKSVTIQ